MDVIQFLNEERRWYSSAKVYAELAPKISAYNITADRLIQLSRIKNGEAIIDLGCGSSGLLINKILSKEPEVTVIYGVDISKEMLNVLNENIVSNSRIKLLHCAAERIQLFLEHKVDRILINSAIWLFSLPDVFVSARNVLNDDGLLVFNIAEWDFILDKSEGRARRGMIDEVLYSHNFTPKRSCGPRTKMTVDELCGILSTTMFDIIQLNYFTTPMSPDDWVLFYSIPAIAMRSLPQLPVDTALLLLKQAMKLMVERNIVDNIRWAEIVAAPKT